MNKKLTRFIILALVIMNVTSLFFLFRPHHRHFGKRPPSLIDVLDIEGDNVAKIRKLENKHFDSKRKIIDEIRSTKRKVYTLISKKYKRETLDSLFSVMNSNQYQNELMTFKYFEEIRLLVPKNKQIELDEFINHVIVNQPGPPPHRK
jgi:hypothetical protein